MYSSPEPSCYWQQTYNVAMVMKKVDETCVQRFMIVHITNNNLYVKTLIATVNCLQLFIVFCYKLVNLICKCGGTVVVLYMYCMQCFMLGHEYDMLPQQW